MTRVVFAFLAAAIIDLINGALILAMPYVALSINAGKLGTAANVASAACYGISCFIFSRKRIFEKREYLMFGGTLVFVACCSLLAVKKTVFTMFLANGVLGIGNAMFYPALQAWFTEGMEKPQLIKTMGGYSIAWVIGFLLGPSIGGYILGTQMQMNERLNIIFIGSAVTALLIGIAFLAFSFRQKLAKLSEKDIPPVFRLEIDQRKCETFLYLMWLSTFCSFFVAGLIRYIFTEVGKTQNINSFVIGNINTMMYLSLILLVILLSHTTFWLFSIRYLLFFQILAIPAVLLFVMFKSIPLYFVGSAVFGFLVGFSFYSSAFYSLIFKGKSDKYISINESMVGIGGFLSGLLGYIFSEFIGLKYSFVPGIFMLLLAMIIEIIIYEKYKKTEAYSQ